VGGRHLDAGDDPGQARVVLGQVEGLQRPSTVL
jgi:hypothetical protein